MCACVGSTKGAQGKTHAHSWRSHIYWLPVRFLPFVSSMRRHLRFHSLCVLLPVRLLLVIAVPHALLVVLQAAPSPVARRPLPLPACLLRNCWKMASQFEARLHFDYCFGFPFLSQPVSVFLLSLSLPFGLAFVYNHVKLNCFAHFPHSAAAAAATSVSIWVIVRQDCDFYFVLAFVWKWKTL